jgi:hypothetical protein
MFSGIGGLTMPRPLLIATLAIALLAARLLGAHFIAFYQHDEVLLAASVATLARDSIGDVYRYGPQVGYYRLVEGLQSLLGGDLRTVPIIMIALSALSGTIIPVCGLFVFPNLLTVSERWVLAGLLVINPILWMSSTYGNSAMLSAALLVVAVTILSNRPRTAWEAAALALYGTSILVRADAVLAFPLIVLLLYLRYGCIRAALTRTAPLVVVLAVVYGFLFLTDPPMAGAMEGVKRHLTNPAFATRFWDYLLWSTSPFILALAAMGVRELLVGRRALMAYVAAWCLPFFAFYYSSTTSPRYFVPTAMPVMVCASVGIVGLVSWLAPIRRQLAATVLALLATLHLFIGLDHFTPGSPRNLLEQAQFETHVGPLWTGAYLYKTYFTPWFLGRSLRHPGFGRDSRTQQTLDTSLAEIASGTERGKTIIVLLGGWNGQVFHYYAHVHGAHYTSRTPGPEWTTFATETWMTLGGARLMSIRWSTPEYRALKRLPVGAGDQVWVLAFDAEIEGLVRAQIPKDLVLVIQGDNKPPVRRYRLVRAAQ